MTIDEKARLEDLADLLENDKKAILAPLEMNGAAADLNILRRVAQLERHIRAIEKALS